MTIPCTVCFWPSYQTSRSETSIYNVVRIILTQRCSQLKVMLFEYNCESETCWWRRAQRPIITIGKSHDDLLVSEERSRELGYGVEEALVCIVCHDWSCKIGKLLMMTTGIIFVPVSVQGTTSRGQGKSVMGGSYGCDSSASSVGHLCIISASKLIAPA